MLFSRKSSAAAEKLGHLDRVRERFSGPERIADHAMGVCHTCCLHHTDNETGLYEFLRRHHNHRTQVIPLYQKPTGGALILDRRSADVVATYGGNASVKEAFGTATAFTKTNANLASSATAGWKSNAIDNSSNLYLDALVEAELAAVNTAPANSKAIFFFAFSLIEGTAYTSTGDGTIDGTEGTVTFPDVTSLPVVAPPLGTIPYPVQNKAINSAAFPVAICFGGILPVKWCIGMVNHSGMTLSVTNIYYIEFYNTVT